MTPLTQTNIEEAFASEAKLQLAATQVSTNIVGGIYDIAHFVESLGFALTSPTVDVRVNGTRLLSDVLLQLPRDYLNATQLDFLTTFYADRLKDHHNVMPAVIDGMNALINMKMLPRESVPKLLHSFFQHSTCQSQLRGDREKLFKIFKFLSEHYASELRGMGGDFIFGLINSMDGERDPRNLDLIFSFMPDLIAQYPLLHLSEDMFEIFACYFPIDFNPSKNDPASITRDNLAAKLANCLVASPDFVEWTVALALEKLESDLVVAKLDSLELLYQAALKFPSNKLEPHFAQIWTCLKTEIFPGGDNADVISAGLRTLASILEQAGADVGLSHNYQTQVLGAILPQLSDVNQRLFNPSTAIALACVAGDAKFAGDKILNTFLLKLQTGTAEVPLPDEQCIRVYNIVAQLFKIASARKALEKLDTDICSQLHSHVIATLRHDLEAVEEKQNLDLKCAALSVLQESVPLLSEANRALVYKALVLLITHDSLDLEFGRLLELLGALHPIELQSNCIDVCIRNFPIYSNFVKRKVFKNFLPLVPQMAFTQRVLDLVWGYIFKPETAPDVRLLALEALNRLLSNEDSRFIAELQNSSCLIDKLVQLAQKQQPLPIEALEQIAAALSRIMQQLSVSEQYMIVSEYLPQLNLQHAADLFVAKGLLGFLHVDISLDDHFERLLDDLTNLSLNSENAQLREVAHYLLCSLVNKIECNAANKQIVAKLIGKLKAEIQKENKLAVEALAWVAKGLIVRGSEDAGGIIEALADLLDHPTLATAASLAFEIISAEYPELHLPIVKFLFKQKFFHTIIAKLGDKLEAYCEHHLKAFIYVLKATPHSVLKMNIEKIGPILFKCLECRQTHTLCIALEICEKFVKQQDEYFRSHLNHIIPSCLQLSKFEESMTVRIKALSLLHDITQYPTFVLLPYKTDVVLDLAAALDDHKRLVRNAAVRTRNAWYLVGSASVEE